MLRERGYIFSESSESGSSEETEDRTLPEPVQELHLSALRGDAVEILSFVPRPRRGEPLVVGQVLVATAEELQEWELDSDSQSTDSTRDRTGPSGHVTG